MYVCTRSVQLIRNNYSIVGRQGRWCGHAGGNGMGGPVRRMCLVSPVVHERVELGATLICGCHIPHASAVALAARAPLCPVRHPGALPGRDVQDHAWLMRPPLADRLPLRRTDLVAPPMNRADILLTLDIHGFANGPDVPLPLAVSPVPVDLASTDGAGGQALARPRPRLLRLDAVGPVVRLGWPGRRPSGPRRQGGLRVDGEHQLIRSHITDNGLGSQTNEWAGRLMRYNPEGMIVIVDTHNPEDDHAYVEELYQSYQDFSAHATRVKLRILLILLNKFDLWGSTTV